jgi:aspartate aminotransferase-like enzyme
VCAAAGAAANTSNTMFSHRPASHNRCTIAPCRYVFQTDTKYVLNMSGTGHAGMEACIANLVEPGETVLVGNKGVWGARVADLAGRYHANVVEMTVGGEARAFTLDEITKHIEQHKPALLFLCQGESSMGAAPPLAASRCARLRRVPFGAPRCSLWRVARPCLRAVLCSANARMVQPTTRPEGPMNQIK